MQCIFFKLFYDILKIYFKITTEQKTIINLQYYKNSIRTFSVLICTYLEGIVQIYIQLCAIEDSLSSYYIYIINYFIIL
jgi:hypothetical protein